MDETLRLHLGFGMKVNSIQSTTVIVRFFVYIEWKVCLCSTVVNKGVMARVFLLDLRSHFTGQVKMLLIYSAAVVSLYKDSQRCFLWTTNPYPNKHVSNQTLLTIWETLSNWNAMQHNSCRFRNIYSLMISMLDFITFIIIWCIMLLYDILLITQWCQ